MRSLTAISAAITLTLAAAPAPGAELTVRVEGDKPAEGDLYAAVYDRPDTFLKDGSSLQSAQRRMDGHSATTHFADLPPGRYAVSVYVDTNGNGELDTNLIGTPTEPYGFSRDARGNMGPPGFEDSAVSIDGDTAVTIKLR